MIRGLFVTGTGTGVGKTVVCAALLHRYRGGAPLRYWKPVQTGIEQDDDTAEVRRLACHGGMSGFVAPGPEILDAGVRLEKPVSPHLAAQWAGETIDLQALCRTVPAGGETRWIIEGAGGALVPLNRTDLMVDFIKMLGVPALIAASSGLGTINHTLLTIEALRARSIPVAGVAMVGDPNADNAKAIEQFGCTRVIAQMPRFDPLTAETLGAWSAAHFDPRGALAEILR